MLLSGWAKLVDNHASFNKEAVKCVEIAIGKNDDGESVKYFVISKAGDMLSTVPLAMHEIHKLHDLPEDGDKNMDARLWLIANVDPVQLENLIKWEKERYFSMYERAKSCKRIAMIQFKDSILNYTIGLKEFVSLEMLEDFYVFNTFNRGVDNVSQECIGVTIFDK